MTRLPRRGSEAGARHHTQAGSAGGRLIPNLGTGSAVIPSVGDDGQAVGEYHVGATGGLKSKGFLSVAWSLQDAHRTDQASPPAYSRGAQRTHSRATA